MAAGLGLACGRPGLAAALALGISDLRSKRHSLLRNYPIFGHWRRMFESVRPMLRQYLVEGDQEEVPSPSSNARSSISVPSSNARPGPSAPNWASTLMATSGSIIRCAPASPTATISGCRWRTAMRLKPYSASVFNISAMSFGSLSPMPSMPSTKAPAGAAFTTTPARARSRPITAKAAAIWCGNWGRVISVPAKSRRVLGREIRRKAVLDQVKMIEIKLSQGAKTGHGGVLPAAKVSAEIARTRGVPTGEDCISPARHSAFDTPEGLLHFVAQLRELSGGKPVGFKLAIGHPWEWFGIAKAMLSTGIKPDFIVVDGGEGGTGAAPMEFADHVVVPMREGLMLVHNTWWAESARPDPHRRGWQDCHRLRRGANAGHRRRLVQRRPRLHVRAGCIQSQACHTDHCPPARPPRIPSAGAPWMCRTRPSGSRTSIRTRYAP